MNVIKKYITRKVVLNRSSGIIRKKVCQALYIFSDYHQVHANQNPGLVLLGAFCPKIGSLLKNGGNTIADVMIGNLIKRSGSLEHKVLTFNLKCK
jgi:hypothetical protein